MFEPQKEATSETTVSSPRVCEHCEKQSAVLLAMAGSKQSPADWYLCPKCWVEGTRSMHDVRDIVEPAVAPVQAEPVSAKDDVGDFTRPKKRKARR